MDFASVFLWKRPFLLLLYSFGFLFPLEVPVRCCLIHQDRVTAMQQLQGCLQQTNLLPKWLWRRPQGLLTPIGTEIYSPPPTLVCWRDAKMSFSFPQESDLLKTNSDWRQFPSPSTQSKIYWQTEKPIAKICFCNKSDLCWPVKTAIESQLWKKIILYRMMQLCFNLSGYFFQQWT